MLREARQGSAAANRAAAQAAEQEAAHKRREAQRRLQPRTPADFVLLHSELEAWRLAETARIKAAGLSPEDCHQALAHLLHQVCPPPPPAPLPHPCKELYLPPPSNPTHAKI